MQPLGRTSSKGTVYTAAQVAALLFAPALQETWKFDWLYPDGRYQGDFTKFLDNQLPPRITHDATRAMKRDLTFNIRSSGLAINPLQDLVRVHYQVTSPDGGFIDFVVGTFALLPPKKEVKVKTNQTFQCADLSQLLIDGAFTGTFSLKAGNTIGTAVLAVVSSLGGPFPFQYSIPDTGRVLVSDLVWEAGVSRLQALNDIMASFSYLPIFFDAFGVLKSAPLPDYSTAQSTFTFDLMNTSAGKIPVSEQKDLSMAFNQCVVVVERSNPTPVSISQLAQNTSVLSEVSIPRWHPKMGPIIRDSTIIDSVVAGQRALYELQKAARIYDPITVQTLPWPVSEDLDYYSLFYNTSDEGVQFNKFLELGWTMECLAGGAGSTHTFQKVFPTS